MKTFTDETLLRLAEIAIAGGWHPNEVANTMRAAIGPLVRKVDRPADKATAIGTSAVVRDAFKRASGRS